MGADKKSRVYRCTMKQNRKTCAVLFEEFEYEQAVLEAYWQAKGKIKLSNNRFPFHCIYCKTSLKDKNTVSYHRMFNLCKEYKGSKPLKMYPTWEPSEHGEKARIAAKYGKASSPPLSGVPGSTPLPPPLQLEPTISRKRTLTVKPAEQDPRKKKRIQTLKSASRDRVPPALATKPAPKLQMTPPPPPGGR